MTETVNTDVAQEFEHRNEARQPVSDSALFTAWLQARDGDVAPSMTAADVVSPILWRTGR